ncbi:F0F1 ATP synthase subunit delta [bacterium]|nr:F0F1 ATP synthase subunit delta [bacterium]
MEFLGKLGIDFKLLIAQIINFLVLLWLLKFFLYKPILKKLEKRAKKSREIEEGEKEIQRKKEEIGKKEEEIIQKAKQKTKQILEEGEEISKEERERIIQRAEEEVREILKEAREKAEVEVEKMRAKEKEIIQKKTKEVLKRVLSLFLTKALHQRYLKEVVEELKKLDFKEIKERDVVSVVVISAFPLSEREEKEISNFLFSKLKNPHFQKKVDPSILAGIRISINGFLIDGSLERKIDQTLSQI